MIEEMADALRNCADELEAEVKAHYTDLSYPSEKRRYERDMQSIHAARHTLAKYSQHEQTDAVDEERIAQLIMDESGEISPQDAGNAAYEILKLLRQPDPRTEVQGDEPVWTARIPLTNCTTHKQVSGDFDEFVIRELGPYALSGDMLSIHEAARMAWDAAPQTQPREE